MARHLFSEEMSEPISPLIDVVVNGMMAMFTMLMIYIIVVQPGEEEPIQLVSAPMTDGLWGQPYFFTFPVTGGCGKREFSITEGQLPEGLVLDEETGLVHGVPILKRGSASQTQEFPITVHIADRRNEDSESPQSEDSKVFTLRMRPSAIPYDKFETPLRLNPPAGTLPVARVGEAYEVVIGVLGGVEPYSWSKVVNFPPGLSNPPPEGRLLGTPQTAGEFQFQVQVTHTAGDCVHNGKRYEWAGARAEGKYELLVLPGRPEPRVGDASFQAWVGEEVNYKIAYRGVEEPVIFTSKSKLPDGLTLDRSGQLHGVSTQVGLSTVSIEIQDPLGKFLKGEVGIRVGLRRKPVQIIVPATLEIVVGQPFQWSPFVSGGECAYRWSIQGGLPQTISFREGILQGKLSQVGAWNITLSVTDEITGQSDSKPLSIRGIFEEPTQPRVLTKSIPTATVGKLYSLEFASEGGVGIPTWVINGNLPSGMQKTKTGIFGRPATFGSFAITVVVQDQVGQRDGPYNLTFTVVQDLSQELSRTQQDLLKAQTEVKAQQARIQSLESELQKPKTKN